MRILPVTLIILTIFSLHRCKVITLKHFLEQPKYFFSSRIIAHNNDLFAFSGKIELEEGSLIPCLAICLFKSHTALWKGTIA